VLTHASQELSVSYRQTELLPQLKMYRELVGWSALLLTLAILYRRNAKGNAISLLTLSAMVLYLFDIYAFEP